MITSTAFSDPAIVALQQAMEAASDAHREQQDKRRVWLREQTAALHVRCGEIFDERENQTRVAYNDAIEAYRTALVNHERANPSWLPEGTRVRAKLFTRYGRDTGKWTYGLVEVWDRGSARPGNRSYYPARGNVVVRLLKKDGQPSLDYSEHTTKWEPCP